MNWIRHHKMPLQLLAAAVFAVACTAVAVSGGQHAWQAVLVWVGCFGLAWMFVYLPDIVLDWRNNRIARQIAERRKQNP